MQAIGNHRTQAQDCRLQLVFTDAVVSLGLPAKATLEDIAERLDRLSERRYGVPLGIFVTLGPAFPTASRRDRRPGDPKWSAS